MKPHLSIREIKQLTLGVGRWANPAKHLIMEPQLHEEERVVIGNYLLILPYYIIFNLLGLFLTSGSLIQLSSSLPSPPTPLSDTLEGAFSTSLPVESTLKMV